MIAWIMAMIQNDRVLVLKLMMGLLNKNDRYEKNIQKSEKRQGVHAQSANSKQLTKHITVWTVAPSGTHSGEEWKFRTKDKHMTASQVLGFPHEELYINIPAHSNAINFRTKFQCQRTDFRHFDVKRSAIDNMFHFFRWTSGYGLALRQSSSANQRISRKWRHRIFQGIWGSASHTFRFLSPQCLEAC